MAFVLMDNIIIKNKQVIGNVSIQNSQKNKHICFDWLTTNIYIYIMY